MSVIHTAVLRTNLNLTSTPLYTAKKEGNLYINPLEDPVLNWSSATHAYCLAD